MSASIFCTTSSTDLDEASLVSFCGKTLRGFLSGKSYCIRGSFFGYVVAKVSDVRRDLQKSSHEERDYLLGQIEYLDDEDEIAVG